MSKDQVVLLVSRAIAIIQCTTAMLEISYLPERLMSLYHYRGRSGMLAAAPDYLTSLYSTEVGLLCFRIAALLVLTWGFWECGPRVRALLSPNARNDAPPEEAPLQG